MARFVISSRSLIRVRAPPRITAIARSSLSSFIQTKPSADSTFDLDIEEMNGEMEEVFGSPLTGGMGSGPARDADSPLDSLRRLQSRTMTGETRSDTTISLDDELVRATALATAAAEMQSIAAASVGGGGGFAGSPRAHTSDETERWLNADQQRAAEPPRSATSGSEPWHSSSLASNSASAASGPSPVIHIHQHYHGSASPSGSGAENGHGSREVHVHHHFHVHLYRH